MFFTGNCQQSLSRSLSLSLSSFFRAGSDYTVTATATALLLALSLLPTHSRAHFSTQFFAHINHTHATAHTTHIGGEISAGRRGGCAATGLVWPHRAGRHS